MFYRFVKGILLVYQITPMQVNGAQLKKISVMLKKHLGQSVMILSLVRDKRQGAPAYCETLLLL